MPKTTPAIVPVDGEIAVNEFHRQEIRKVLNNGEWYFSVIDVVAAIAESPNPRRYWSDLKRSLAEKEGFAHAARGLALHILHIHSRRRLRRKRSNTPCRCPTHNAGG